MQGARENCDPMRSALIKIDQPIRSLSLYVKDDLPPNIPLLSMAVSIRAISNSFKLGPTFETKFPTGCIARTCRGLNKISSIESYIFSSISHCVNSVGSILVVMNSNLLILGRGNSVEGLLTMEVRPISARLHDNISSLGRKHMIPIKSSKAGISQPTMRSSRTLVKFRKGGAVYSPSP